MQVAQCFLCARKALRKVFTTTVMSTNFAKNMRSLLAQTLLLCFEEACRQGKTGTPMPTKAGNSNGQFLLRHRRFIGTGSRTSRQFLVLSNSHANKQFRKSYSASSRNATETFSNYQVQPVSWGVEVVHELPLECLLQIR